MAQDEGVMHEEPDEQFVDSQYEDHTAKKRRRMAGPKVPVRSSELQVVCCVLVSGSPIAFSLVSYKGGPDWVAFLCWKQKTQVLQKSLFRMASRFWESTRRICTLILLAFNQRGHQSIG